MRISLDTPKAIFLILFVVVLGFLVIFDPDLFWHLKTGEWIITHKALPEGDPFSYTRAGAAWVMHEWLFQTLLYAIHRLAGDFGLKLLTASFSVLALYLAFRAAAGLSRRPMPAALIALACFVVMAPNISPRPQLATFLFFAFTLLAIVRHKYAGDSRWLWAVPPLMILWVNMHAGFMAGIALLALAAAGEWLSGRRSSAATLAKVTLATLLCSAVNPDFVHHWLYPFQVMAMDASGVISEWKSPDMHTLRGKLFLLLLIGFFILNIYRNNKPDWTELAIPLFFIAAAFTSARHIPLAMLSMMPFAAAALADGAGTTLAGMLPERIRRRPAALEAGELGAWEGRLNVGLLQLVILITLLVQPAFGKFADTRRNAMLPVGATHFILDSGLRGRMFNEYRFGGYLIYHLYPQQKVFIDGRPDMYGDAFFHTYGTIFTGSHGWQQAFDHYNIDYVVCSRDAPIRQLLLARGDFTLVYDDAFDSVLVRNAPEYAGLIARYGVPAQ